MGVLKPAKILISLKLFHSSIRNRNRTGTDQAQNEQGTRNRNRNRNKINFSNKATSIIWIEEKIFFANFFLFLFWITLFWLLLCRLFTFFYHISEINYKKIKTSLINEWNNLSEIRFLACFNTPKKFHLSRALCSSNKG